MITQDFFNERRSEIETYFEFLESIITYRAKLVRNMPKKAGLDVGKKVIDISLDLSHTLKANGFLLLYNMVEATLLSAIEEIHDSICADRTLGADELVETLARQAIGRVNSKDLPLTSPLSKSILQHWINDHKQNIDQHKNSLFSGNVDAKVIKGLAKIYGFSAEAKGRAAKNGTNLIKVRIKRNELAHGKISFKDCGRDIVLEELIQIKSEVISYLEQILVNIEHYINNKSYIRTALINGVPNFMEIA